MGDTEARWLSYRELAELLGISLRAAEARARRHIRAGRWRHRIDNDARKTGRVLVPAADIDATRQGTPGVTRGDAVGNTRGDTRPLLDGSRERGADPLVAALQVALQTAKDRADQEAREAVEQRERAARAEGEVIGQRVAIEQLQGRVQRAEAERDDATSLTRQVIGQLEATARERVDAQARAVDLRQHLDRAEAERDGARTEAAVLRDAEARAAARVAAERAVRKAAEAAAEAARGELATLTAGGPLRRALRAFTWRRGSL
jgi:hypothetical protein